MSLATLFGAPLGYSAETLESWISELEARWRDFAVAASSDLLDDDLELLRDLFAQGASAAKLRDTFARLRSSESELDLPAQIAVDYDGARLITPEGRILLHTLHRLRRTGGFVIEPAQAQDALSRASNLRSDWYQSWVTKQLSGTASPAVLGGIVLLLVNGSTDPSHALILPDDESSRPGFRDVVLDIVGEFSFTLGAERPVSSPLRNHWVFTQASRTMSRDVARSKGRSGAEVFVRPGREEELLSRLADRLSKYPRPKVTAAVHALVERYRLNRGAFSSFGMMNERPAHTQHVVDALTMDR